MKKKELPIEEIVRKYEDGKLIRLLAEEYSVSVSTISRKIEEYYEEAGKEKPQKKYSKKDLPNEDIIKKYEDGILIRFLAEEYEVQQGTMSKKIKEAYKERGKERTRRLRSATIIVDYLKRGLTIEEIIEMASKKDVIIPQDIINTALNKVHNKNITDDNEER